MFNLRFFFSSLFALVFIVGSCATCDFDKMPDSPYSNYKSVLKIKNSVVLLKVFKLKKLPCQEEACIVPEKEQISQGTGTVVGKSNPLAKNQMSLVLTAEHVCSHIGKISLLEAIEVATSKGKIEIFVEALDIHGHTHTGQIIELDERNDLCMVRINSNIDVPAVKVASMAPEYGDHVFYFGAPLGMFSSDGLPMWNGFYVGFAKYKYKRKLITKRSLFSKQSVYPGSSGSAIVNKHGEIISVVSSFRIWQIGPYPAAAPDINFGASWESTKKIIDSWNHLLRTTSIF